MVVEAIGHCSKLNKLYLEGEWATLESQSSNRAARHNSELCHPGNLVADAGIRFLCPTLPTLGKLQVVWLRGVNLVGLRFGSDTCGSRHGMHRPLTRSEHTPHHPGNDFSPAVMQLLATTFAACGKLKYASIYSTAQHHPSCRTCPHPLTAVTLLASAQATS